MKVKQVAIDAEDLVDGWLTNTSAAAQLAGSHTRIHKVLTWLGIKTATTTGSLRRHISEIDYKLYLLESQQLSLGLPPSTLEHYSPLVLPRKELTSSSFVPDETFVVGRDIEKQNIIDLLLCPTDRAAESSSNRNFSVLPIVGPGGIGKTTLAQLVFSDQRVKEHFHLMMWVRVSYDFDPIWLLKEMIEAALASKGKPERCKIADGDAMHQRLHGEVEGKTFLLVLDDVCKADQSKWEELLKPLHSGKKGSKILVISRHPDFPHQTRSLMDPPIPLEGLSSADLWSLLKRCALGGVTDADGTTSAQYSHLKAIGMSIVQRLGGSPLAARIIGSLLKKKLDVHHWKTVLESKLRYLDPDVLLWGKGKDGILPAVLLSYEYLDGALKQCFAHCSLFPKGYTFDREDVVQQWKAQCFIRTDRGTRMDMSGSRYFDELLSLSFFEFTTCYAMHDAVHDLAECVSSDGCFRLEDERYEKIPLTVRHMSVCLSKCDPARLLSLSRYEKLRTLLFLPGFEFDGFMSSHVLDEMFSKFKHLRVLGLRHCQIKELPESVGDLKQLRYLDLSGNELLRRLPESLGNLCHLQTLKLEGCGVLHALPARMSELTSLRRLQADDVLVSNIDGLGKLTNLEELRVRGRRVRALEGMSMLRKVSVWDLEEVESKEEAIQIRLHSMSCLQVLQLEWSTRRRRDRMPMTREAAAVVVEEEEEEGVLQALRPNGDSIEELHIWGYRGAKSPDWMGAPTVASFSRLRHVVVGCCPNCPDLPSSLCQLPLLESIKISSMPRWEGWDADRFNALQDPSSAVPFFPRLRELQIRKCPKLTELPLLPRTLKSLHLEAVGLACLPGLRPLLQSSGSSSSSSSASVALSRLHIRSCHNLTSVSGLLQLQLPSLKEVVIETCRQLGGFPEKGFGHLPSLEKLWVLRCPNLQRPALPPTKYLPLFLEELRVHWCGEAMGWWWLAGLRRLRYLANLSLRGGPAMAGTFTTASS